MGVSLEERTVVRDDRFDFIARYGLAPASLTEMHVYALSGRFEDFPLKVIALLRLLHASGNALGAEIMALIHHRRPLREGEAVYIAVCRGERTAAFVDRYRPAA